jgi:hypothetical protein
MQALLLWVGMIAMAVAGLTLFAAVYLQTQLISALRRHDPELWEHLGSPLQTSPRFFLGLFSFRSAFLGREPLDTRSGEVARAYPPARIATFVSAGSLAVAIIALLAYTVSAS